jgi:hypothetical protein
MTHGDTGLMEHGWTMKPTGKISMLDADVCPVCTIHLVPGEKEICTICYNEVFGANIDLVEQLLSALTVKAVAYSKLESVFFQFAFGKIEVTA